jgi:hypothetical protein
MLEACHEIDLGDRRMMAKRFLLAGACLAAAACGSEPGVYDLPRQEVYDRLASNPLDALKFRRACGILIHLLPSARNGDEIDWRVTHNGHTKVQFSIRLEELSPEQTRVSVSVDSKDADGSEAYDGDYFTPYPAFQQPLRPAIEEAIAATLEGREFDPSRAPHSRDDDVCDVQRATLQQNGVPIDVVMQQRADSGSDALGDDGWGSGTTD